MESPEIGFINLVQKSKEILIIIPPNPTDDTICSAFGLSHLLQKMQKQVSLLFMETLPERLNFLKKPESIIKTLSGARDFTIIFSTKYNKILKVKTEEKEHEYIIRITPESGSIDPRDFSFVPAQFKWDLTIIINAASLESLGAIYQKNTDLFFEVPKVNIDTHNSNEQYGQVNLVDMAASSASQILAKVALEHYEKTIDKDIAQAFLSGIISATDSFQKPTTSPQSMVIAAKLMKYKADQPTIIRHLYKTKSLSFLKLWGRVMARLNWNEKHKYVWSLVSIEDLVQSRASEQDLPYILEQIQENFIEGQLFAVFYSQSAKSSVVQIRCTNDTLARQLASAYNIPTQHRRFVITFENKNLLEAEKDILDTLDSLS